MSDRLPIRFWVIVRSRPAYLIPLVLGASLMWVSITLYQPTQFKLAGAIGERIAEDELHPGKSGPETQYLKDLRTQAAHDSMILMCFMLASVGFNFLAGFILLVGRNRKIRLSDTDRRQPRSS